MDNREIIRTLEEIAVLLELKGENAFKCRAYENAARALSSQKDSVEQLVKSGLLSQVKGIGKGLQEKITEMVKTGRSAYHEELKSAFPAGLLNILRIPSLGPKKAKILFDQLSISSVGELEYACRENRLLILPGFGEKTQTKILQGIEMVKRFQGRYHYPVALEAAQAIQRVLSQLKDVQQLSICGSLRRAKEVIRDIDLLVASENPGPVMDAFVSFEGVEQVSARGETKSSVILSNGIQADLRVVGSAQYPFALNYFTGSKEHNTRLRGVAKKKGYKLNEYGLFEGERLLVCNNEEELYERLGLQCVPPEMREDTGEIEAAMSGKIPDLVEHDDLVGILHNHTTYSDGKLSVEQMALEANRRGYKYIGIADHSRSAVYANGLSEERIRQQFDEIDQVNAGIEGITVLKGIESDILPDGNLDYTNEVLSEFDYVIASVHSRFNMTEEEMTKRICRALENPHVSMIGHPTGRLLLSREPYPVDLNQVLSTARKLGKSIELNAHPFRLDLIWQYCKVAREMNVPVCINPDAHDAEGLDMVRYGVAAARRGWLEKEDVLNSRDLNQIEDFLQKRDLRIEEAK